MFNVLVDFLHAKSNQIITGSNYVTFSDKFDDRISNDLSRFFSEIPSIQEQANLFLTILAFHVTFFMVSGDSKYSLVAISSSFSNNLVVSFPSKV